jgi:hypothetical protein
MPKWFVSSLMMDRALDAVVRRVKKTRSQARRSLSRGLQQGRQNHLYRSPHAGVISLCLKEINTDRYLILHEEVEETLID